MLKRVNMDLDNELWKEVGKKAIDWEMKKKEIVESALREYINNKEES